LIVLSNAAWYHGKRGLRVAAFHWAQEKPHANYLVHWSPVISRAWQTSTATFHWPFMFRHRTSRKRRTPFAIRATSWLFLSRKSASIIPGEYYQVMVQDFMEGGMEKPA